MTSLVFPNHVFKATGDWQNGKDLGEFAGLVFIELNKYLILLITESPAKSLWSMEFKTINYLDLNPTPLTASSFAQLFV